MRHAPPRVIVLVVLAGLTIVFAFAMGAPVTGERVFYVVAYHYGYAIFDERFVERPAIEVRAGETVTLTVVPAQILGRGPFFQFAERSLARPIGGFPAGDPRIRRKIEEDLALGNADHIVAIADHPLYLATGVAATLGATRFHDGPPRTVEAAVRARHPAIRSATLTAKRVGSFDVLCVDSGVDGPRTCGWGHTWMTVRDGFVVRP